MRANSRNSNVAWILLIQNIYNVFSQFSAQSKIHSYFTKPHWFSFVLSTLQRQRRRPSTEWVVGGQGQPAAEGVAESALRTAALKMSSLVGRRRPSERQCLIPRWEAWDLFDMDNSRRSVHGTRLVRSVLGGQAHYLCWNWAPAGSPIFWDKHIGQLLSPVRYSCGG